jgi:hypothetical protein
MHYEFLIFFANLLSIHYPIGNFTTDQLFFSRTYFEFTISFAYSLWILYLFREFTINSLSHWQIHYGSIIFFANFEFTISFGYSLWILYLFREFTINSLSQWQIHFGSIIFFANLRDSLFVREFTLYLLSLSRIYYGSINFSLIDPEYTISFANSLSIHYLFRELTMNTLSSSPIRYIICIAISLSNH